MFKLIIAFALSPLCAQCAPVNSPAPAPATGRVLIGELQEGSFDVSPPTRLDVNMWQGTLAPGVSTYRGGSVQERCDDMGGTLGAETFRGDPIVVCHGVDY